MVLRWAIAVSVMLLRMLRRFCLPDAARSRAVARDDMPLPSRAEST